MSGESEETMKEQPRLFLSYCDKDRAIVEDIVTFIRTLQVILVMDKEVLLAANSISETLRRMIQSCHGCLWVLTENSVKSGWCPLEVGAFWGAGLPIIIYNPSGITYEGPFSDIKQARTLDELKRAIKGLEVRGKAFSTVTIEEATKIIEKTVSIAVRPITEYLPTVISEYTKLQNTPLPNHAAVLSKITNMLERGPKKLFFAFDVPSFGSVSAEREYRIFGDVFDTYIAKEEWDVTILLLPADVGVKIVNTEFTDLQKRMQAWTEDIDALRRFQGYKQRAGQRGNRRFKIGWLAINREASGAPSGLHSMPLNVWIANDEEAVFSTVIDNYRPTGENLTNSSSQVQEIGFSTRNPDMVRFLIEITEKYAQNIDETLTLASQINASEEAKAKIERLIKARGDTRNAD
jgi:hypothetical protein